MYWRVALPIRPQPVVSFRRLTWSWLLGLMICGVSLGGSTCAADDDAAQRRELLPRYAPRHRRLKETLAAVDQLQSVGRAAESLKTVQWILDQPFDTLLFVDGQPAASVKRLAEDKLRAFPAEWRQQYERTYGQEARRLFDEAKHRREDPLAIEVLRRFPTSAVAEEVAVWLSLRWLDQGEPSLAAALLIPEDITPPALRELGSSRLSAALQAAVAAGVEHAAQAIHQELAGRTDAIAQAILQRPLRRPVRPLAALPPNEYLTVPPNRDVEDFALSLQAIPVIHPLWTSDVPSRESSLHLAGVLETWRGQLQETSQSPVVPNLPLVIRGQLILRDYEGICGRDLASGRPLWKFACESSISTWVDDVARNQHLSSDAGSVFAAETLQWWFGSNTQLGYLSSDGIRLYAVDSLMTPTLRQASRQDPFQSRPDEPNRAAESNRLLALELPTRSEHGDYPSPKLAWSSGRSPLLGAKDREARYFLGPPLPSAGRLLCLAETDREIRLLALHPETGVVLWEQPVAAADKAAVYDGERAFVACQPLVSGGLILCPTQIGVLAAVDAVTGTLRWSYFDQDLPPEPAKRPRGTITSRGRLGFAPCTIIHGGRVVHLPTASSSVHCLELETGRQLWSQPRRRACSIAQVSDDVVLLLEDQGCRAVKLSDGTDVWQQPLGSITGTGFTLGTNYLVPLERGRFALLDSSTGRIFSWQPPRTSVSLGNLLACGDLVLSVNPFSVSAFPQAEFVRRMLQDRSAPLSPADQSLFSADLSLAEGDFAAAEQFLDASLRAPLPKDQQTELKHLLRELLYQRLTDKAEMPGPLLSRLEDLAESPEERGRFLARQARFAVSSQDLRLLRQALLELAKLPIPVTFAAPDEAGWRQSASACCRQLLSEVEQDAPEFASSFRAELQEKSNRRAGNAAPWEEWRFTLRVCSDDLAAGSLRSTLARRLEHDGQWQPAELLWLQNRHHEDARLAGEAAAGFVRLWSKAGWPRDAALLLREQTGRELLEQFPAGHPARQWSARLAAPAGQVRGALIHATSEMELPTVDTLQRQRNRIQPEDRNPGRYGEFARRVSLSESLSAEVLLRAEATQSKFVVIDKSTSQPVGAWPVPVRHSHPGQNSNIDQGHFLPIGVPGELRGYSLLQPGREEPAWTQRPAELQGRRAIPTIGPGGPGFVTFQAQNLLFVCDPWDGSILWQRETLEPQSGLYANPRTGITGDEKCLVVFGADRFNYVMYDTLSGRPLRSGRLELEPRHSSWAYGRKLFSVSQGRGQWLVRAWDPWEDRWDLDESMGDRNTAVQCVGSSEVAWLSPAPDNELRLFDMAQSKRTLTVRFPEEEMEGFNALRVISERDRCYVNLWRNQQAAQTRDYNYPLQDVLAPWIPHLRDDLYAIDRREGRILWKRTLPNRTLLQVDPPGLPFLVLASLIRDAQDGNQRSLLVEVLDADTGELLGRNDHLPLDRIVNVEYDGVHQSLRVIGQHSVVEVQLLLDRDAESPRRLTNVPVNGRGR